MARGKMLAWSVLVVGLLVAPVGPLAAAQDTAGSQVVVQDCEDLAQRLISAFETRASGMRDRDAAFQQKQAQERDSFGSQARTDEEWKAFEARQAEASARFYRDLDAEYQRALDDLHARYRAECGAYEAHTLRDWSPPPHRHQATPRPIHGEPAMPASSPTRADSSCADLETQLRQERDRFHQQIAAEKQAFAERQRQEAEAFFAQERTDAERRAFAERQGQAAYQASQGWQSRIEAKENELRERWRAGCAPIMGDATTAASPSDACKSDMHAWEQARFAFETQMRTRRASFEQEWRAKWDEKSRSGASEDDMAAFRRAFADAQLALEQEMRLSFESWQRDHPSPAACAPPMMVLSQACEPERMRLEAHEFERLLRERYLGVQGDGLDLQVRMDAKWRAFHAEWEQRRADHQARQPTPEQTQAFEAEWREAEMRFRASMEAEHRAHADRMAMMEREFQAKVRIEMERFLRAQAERCWQGEARPTASPLPAARPGVEFRMVHDDLDRARQVCVLEVRLQLQEFETGQLRALRDHLQGDRAAGDLERFEAAQREERVAFEARLKLRMADCEKDQQDRYRLAASRAYDGAPPRERMGSFSVEQDPEAGEVRVRGKSVAFTGDMATEALYDYTVGGRLFFDAVRKDTPFVDFGMEQARDGTVMVMRGQGLVYRVHDNPNGLFNFRVGEGSIELDVADYLAIEVRPRGVELRHGDASAMLLGDRLEVDGDRIVVRGAAEFIVQGQRQEVLDKVSNKHRPDIAAAVQQRRVAAEVTVVPSGDGVKAEKLTYEDMTIEVERTQAKGLVSFRVDKPDHEARTLVFNVDKDLLGLRASLLGRLTGASAAASVEVRVFDVQDGQERPLRAQRASSLADVLDPTDDETVEFWPVMDEDGVQVIVSFTGFSEKRVEVQGLQAQGDVSRTVPGFPPLALLAALGVAVLLVRRRA